MSLARTLRLALASSVLSAVAGAAVIVVDDDGGVGVDFTDLPPAVAAAAPGDLILVHPGVYSSFVLAKGVTILGTAPNVIVDFGTRVTGLPGSEIAVLAEMELRDLRVLSSAGTVVLESISIIDASGSPQPQLLLVEDCTDVRARGDTIGANFGFGGQDGVFCRDSRLELVQSVVRGEQGFGSDCGSGSPGGHGMFITGGARVHLSQTDVLGGTGGWVNATCGSFCNLNAGDGGNGVEIVGAPNTLFVMGQPTNFIEGGFAGDGGACMCDGFPGIGLFVNGATATYSGAQLIGGGAFCGSGNPLIVIGGGTATQSVPPDPFLQLQGTPAPSAPIRFTVYGEPGDQATLYLGRFPVLIPIPGVAIEKLTSEERMFDLGTIGAAGNASFNLNVPGHLKQGFLFHGQGAVQRGGQEYRTNSVPVVLR